MLHRAYRPTTWAQVVGQEHIVRILTGALASDRVGHAYLLAGPRGTGKTTVARILAKAVNCTAAKAKPCGKCALCVSADEGTLMDLVEIDAASNRGIDDVRQLKETAATSPALASRKVFIVDEVHMLSKEAFNALLKLLEEPPAHAMFVLATTEPHKVLPTILSRVQRLDFRKLTVPQIAGKLAAVAKSEKLKAEPEALAAMAMASDGALRDAEVMLTKLAAHGEVTAEALTRVLGLVPDAWYTSAVTALAGAQRADTLRLVHEAAGLGADFDVLFRGLLEYLRAVMVAKIDPTILAASGAVMSDHREKHVRELADTMDGAWLVRAIQTLTRARTELKSSPIASLPLELAVIELTEPKHA